MATMHVLLIFTLLSPVLLPYFLGGRLFAKEALTDLQGLQETKSQIVVGVVFGEVHGDVARTRHDLRANLRRVGVVLGPGRRVS